MMKMLQNFIQDKEIRKIIPDLNKNDIDIDKIK